MDQHLKRLPDIVHLLSQPAFFFPTAMNTPLFKNRFYFIFVEDRKCTTNLWKIEIQRNILDTRKESRGTTFQEVDVKGGCLRAG